MENKGSNPVCDFANYKSTVSMYCHQVQKLDGEEINFTPTKPNKIQTAIRGSPVNQAESQGSKI